MSNVTRILKVLFLDSYTWHLPRLDGVGLKLVVTSERDWNPEPYEAPRSTLDRIAALTATENFDLVIVGNNLGAGVAKAGAIADRLKSRSIVVWNEYAPGVEGPYLPHGMTRFMSRPQMRDHILKMVAN